MRIAVVATCLLFAACGDSEGPGTQAVASIAIVDVPTRLVPNETRTVQALVRGVDGSTLSGKAIEWSTSNAAAATIDGGLLRGVAPGAAAITARSGNVVASFSVTVDEGGFIGAAGGTVSAFNNGVSVVVPANAVTASIAIRIVAVATTPLDPTYVAGSAVTLAFDGTFAAPARLVLNYNPAAAPQGLPETKLGVRRLDNTTWTSIAGSTVDASNNTAAANITAPGTYGVGMRPSESPCTGSEYRAFDFRLGNFNWAGPSSLFGEAEIAADANGCVIREALRIGSTAEVRAVLFYEPGDGKWHYTSVEASATTRLTGGPEAGKLVLYTSNRQRRVVWEVINADEHKQSGEASTNGTDWSRTGEGIYTRKGATASNVITPAGGKIVLAGGAITIDAPAGAVTQNVAVTAALSASGGPSDPALVRGRVVTLTGTPSVTFAQPVRITLAYDPASGPLGVPESQFGLARAGATAWAMVPATSVDVTANTVTALTTTLGQFSARRAEPATPCTAEEHRQFDFWLGEWDVNGVHSTIARETGGCAIYETYRAPTTGRSISVYDPASGKWYQTYVSGANVLPMSGGMENGKMVMFVRTPNGDLSQRWTWEKIDDVTVVQTAEGTSNNGATWQTAFVGTYKRR